MALAVVGVVAAIFGFTWVPSGPPIGPDLDCADIGHQVRVDGADPHRLDADGDGLGCEFEGKQFGWLGVLGLVGAGTGGVMAYSRRDG